MSTFLTSLRSVANSLFVRLVLIFGVSFLAIMLVFSASFRYIMNDNLDQEMGHNILARYVQTIIDDIGTPPDSRQAQLITRELPIAIIITGADYYWQSEQMTIDLTQPVSLHIISQSMQMIRLDRTRAIKVEQDGYAFYLLWKGRFHKAHSNTFIYIVLLATLTILMINYLLVRRLFQPIKLLKQGAERISQGELGFRVEQKRSDELGELTISVNNMADALQSMLDAKQQLLLAISHELRSPITRAKLQLEFINQEDIKSSLRDDIDELDQLVSELLEAERLSNQSAHSALNLEQVLFAEFIQQVIHKYQPQNKQVNHSLQFSLTGEDQMIAIDCLRISLLLRNLMANAIRFGQDKEINIDVCFDQNFAILTVRDQGYGISAEHLPHLTEPFYRADSARQRQTGGFGLGLYLCRLITDIHDGELKLASLPGKGTTVTVKLPLQ